MSYFGFEKKSQSFNKCDLKKKKKHCILVHLSNCVKQKIKTETKTNLHGK